MYKEQIKNNEEDKSIREKLDEILDETKKKREKKKFKLPLKAKVNKVKAKKGFVTIQVVKENGVVEFRKEPIIDSVIKLSEGDDLSFHAIDSQDILSYKGNPFLILPKNKMNPYNPTKGENETYGDKYVVARMISDQVKMKKKLGWGISIGVIIILGIVAYAFLTGG